MAVSLRQWGLSHRFASLEIAERFQGFDPGNAPHCTGQSEAGGTDPIGQCVEKRYATIEGVGKAAVKRHAIIEGDQHGESATSD